MRTITYSVADYTSEEDHGGFAVIETETLHAVTGDEVSHYDVPLFFATAVEARAWIDAELAALAQGAR